MAQLLVVAADNGSKVDEREFNTLLDLVDYYISRDGKVIDVKKMDTISSLLPMYECDFLDGYLTAHNIPPKYQKEIFQPLHERVEHFLPENPWHHLDEIFPLHKDIMKEYLDKWLVYHRIDWK